MKANIVIIFSLAAFGCSSTVQNLPEGSEGGASGGVGGIDSGISGGVGGIDSGISGGVGGIDSRISGGAGGISGSAGNSVGGTGPCIPITCFTYGVRNGGDACGIVDDGCGNYIDCGGCGNARLGCGADSPSKKGTPNICNILCDFNSWPGDPFDPSPEICSVYCGSNLGRLPSEVLENCSGAGIFDCPCSDWENL